MTSNKFVTKPIPPKKITALVHFGRSGTGLLHSLIDGHSEISTLPSYYFREFFDHSNWQHLIAGGWNEIVDRFISTYEVLFDAASPDPIIWITGSVIIEMGRKEGMANVGEKKDEALVVDNEVVLLFRTGLRLG